MAGETHLCKSCGRSIRPVPVTPGSFFIELFLWILIFVPGLLYSAWRVSSRYSACPACKSGHIIPLDSPFALSVSAADGYSVTEQIEKLAILKDNGILTPEEFDLKKTELLGKI